VPGTGTGLTRMAGGPGAPPEPEGAAGSTNHFCRGDRLKAGCFVVFSVDPVTWR
jgi:hypothetical protein